MEQLPNRHTRMKKTDQNRITRMASDAIRVLMLEKQITTHKLCGLINEAGYKVSPPTVRMWVADPLKMNYMQTKYLSDILGITSEQMDGLLRTGFLPAGC
jgi:hypothetical protein